MLNPFDHATHIVVFNIPLLDPLIDTRSLVKMRPYACGLHDGAEVGSFQFIQVVVKPVEGLLFAVDLVGYGELDLAEHLVHVVDVD